MKSSKAIGRTCGLVLATLSLSYGVLFGPAFWVRYTSIDPEIHIAAYRLYRPMYAVMNHGPQPVRDALAWFVGLWTPASLTEDDPEW